MILEYFMVAYQGLGHIRQPFRWGLIAQTVSYILRLELCFSPESPGLVLANQHIPTNQPSFHQFRWNRLIHSQDIILIWIHFYRSTLNTPLFIARGETKRKLTKGNKERPPNLHVFLFVKQTKKPQPSQPK